MKRIIIAHGWGGSPDESMLKWIRESMESEGCEVIAPLMPHPDTPTIEDWVPALGNSVGLPDEDTYFVGHSVGCQTTLRYIATLPENIKIGGILLIAPWFVFTLESLDDGESPDIATPWLKTPISFNHIRIHTDKIAGIFSDNDPYVLLTENKILLEKELNAETITLHERGHFTGLDNVRELPEALDVLREMMK
ncbi:alpha/beta hydrolase [Candidatus Nomurabacteria bacterium]|nr:MAG: alpha/beta hydrolase [Candidatus Nomurabacteria bacterium]